MLARQLCRWRSCGLQRRWNSTKHDGFHISLREPPNELLPGFRERPTPVLFLPWECRGAVHWAPHLDYLAERGITAAAFNYREDGIKNMEVAALSLWLS